jgi:uncharacterized protein YtpQ (UPF0354 family)
MERQDLRSRAIAYLVTRGSKEGPAVTLSVRDAPVLIGYVVDHGAHFQYIQRRHLWAAGMTQTELHRNAVANLASMLNDRCALVHTCEDGFIVLFDGHFDASLILVDALWDKALADLAPNGFVAALPNKNALAFCDLRTSTGPQQLRRFIEDAGIGDHPITTTLYYRDPTHRDWRPYSL